MLSDLSRRHRQPEIMDAPDLPPARFTETLKGLEIVNAVTGSSSADVAGPQSGGSVPS